jgi:DNA modification methylase
MRIVGDCREVLRDLPKGSVQTCVTSPPYWGLRDYGVKRQIGLERTPELFVEEMVNVFRLVREVLADDGTLWLNLGDSYSGGGGFSPDSPSNQGRGQYVTNGKSRLYKGRAPASGLKPKDLIGMPWRVAFALQADGWYLRSDIIWHKPNPMPESVRDRPTKSHEYLFLLTKGPRYFYDAEAVREPSLDRTGGGQCPDGGPKINFVRSCGSRKLGRTNLNPAGRNRRTVWTITPKPYPGAHFATFPPKLVEPCILAGTSEKGHCPQCGARWVRVVERTRPERYGGKSVRWGNDGNGMRMPDKFNTEHKTLGFRPTCDHNRKPVPDVVLDPFGGSGTTGQVAEQLGRDWVLIELSGKYAKLIDDRMRKAA